jgi:hypothetical protein
MKAKLIFAVLFGISILVACAPKTIPTPTAMVTHSLTSTPILQTSTPTVEWVLLATPLNLSYSTNDEIISIIDELFPGNCIRDRENLLTVNPTPIEPAMQVRSLRFTQIASLPEPNPNYLNERADNIDNSRTAFVGCQPGDCSKFYVKDNKLGKFYEIRFGAATDRPLGYLHWINKDTVVVAQEGHLWTLIVAINVDKQQFEYLGMTPGCPIATPTP